LVFNSRVKYLSNYLRKALLNKNLGLKRSLQNF
jgi:hypothetical protein